MASTNGRFTAHDPTTWTSERMCNHLQCGTMHDIFFKLIFDWDDAKLQTAVQLANDALARAGIKPKETLCRIRLAKGTTQWTEGAYKRLTAEADLVLGDSNADGLFDLPHERNETPRPAWFRKDMMYSGRQPKVVYPFPTITQKFFQHARDKVKGDVGPAGGACALSVINTTMSPPSTPKPPVNASKNDIPRNGTSQRSKPQLDEADVHIGWIIQQDDGTFIMEKDFRSLRTWLDGPELWNYDYEKIRLSLRMTENPDLQLFWFETLEGQPWIVKDDHAVAGAIERMHRKGGICFLLARSIDHVRALTVGQRGKCTTPSC